ncbi:hypothetical protein [Pleomorphovibrio marinus]|uniref:hypothetical protein n=1 Tax=Pleomorphovibrio marinus TaxID=2164132 RepID=UPI000E0A0464|nr:hypothetical protein [Pleomorphovibrio marinus]
MELFLDCFFVKIAIIKKQISVFKESGYSITKEAFPFLWVNLEGKSLQSSKKGRDIPLLKSNEAGFLFKKKLLPGRPNQSFRNFCVTFFHPLIC